MPTSAARTLLRSAILNSAFKAAAKLSLAIVLSFALLVARSALRARGLWMTSYIDALVLACTLPFAIANAATAFRELALVAAASRAVVATDADADRLAAALSSVGPLAEPAEPQPASPRAAADDPPASRTRSRSRANTE